MKRARIVIGSARPAQLNQAQKAGSNIREKRVLLIHDLVRCSGALLHTLYERKADPTVLHPRASSFFNRATKPFRDLRLRCRHHDR